MDRPCEPSQKGLSGDGILDSEFRRILWSIKQYIPFINSNYQLALYRSWLEKLSLSNFEKIERNMYLFELARQIRSNTILPPFNQPPPAGSLKDLPKINHFRSSDAELPNPTTRWPDEELAFQPPTYVEQNYCNPQQIYPEIKRPYYPPPPVMHQHNPTSHSACYNKHLDDFYYNMRYGDDDDEVIDELIEEKLKSIPKMKKKAKPGLALPVCPHNAQYPPVEINIPKETEELPKGVEKVFPQENPSRDVPKMNEQHPPVEQDSQGVKDDSSWCDLTDASVTSIANSLASGDCEKKGVIVQQRVQRFNEFKRVVEESATQMESIGVDPELTQRRKSNTNLNATEPDAWVKIQHINEAKQGLKDTNFISADWKKTIEGLQLRLTETLHQNNELKTIINAMQLKLQEEANKLQDQNQNQKKLAEQHIKEIEALKQVQDENIKQLEKSFEVKLDKAEIGYHEKVEKIKATYEIKMKELKVEREHAKKEKDKEVTRLTEIVQQQCTRMSNEIAALRHQIETSIVNNNEEKIQVLQKCVSKMEKLFQKSEKEYQKQLEKLKQELDLKDKVMQVQLKTQRAELIARTTTEKQRHFDDVVNNLEVKYIKMLEYHEAQVMETRKQDEEKMDRLMNLLDKNEICFD